MPPFPPSPLRAARLKTQNLIGAQPDPGAGSPVTCPSCGASLTLAPAADQGAAPDSGAPMPPDAAPMAGGGL